MRKMRNCPFCNKEVEAEHYVLGIHYNEDLGQWLFNHFCNLEAVTMGVTITVYGDSFEDVVDKWNGVQPREEAIKAREVILSGEKYIAG